MSLSLEKKRQTGFWVLVGFSRDHYRKKMDFKANAWSST